MKTNVILVFAGASAVAAGLFLSAGCSSRTATTSNAVPVVTPAVVMPVVPPTAPPVALAAPATRPTASKVTLKVVKVDSEETAGEDGKGANAVDGDKSTFWHTQWQDANPTPPHEIVIEITPPATIMGFTYLPRQDDSDHGGIKGYEFYVSNDGQEFGQPVAKGEFENTKDLKTVKFAPKACHFVKLKALSEVNDEAWTSAAEIGVIEAQ